MNAIVTRQLKRVAITWASTLRARIEWQGMVSAVVRPAQIVIPDGATARIVYDPWYR